MIIDEAHNIMDAVANVHAADLRLTDLKRARQMLGIYFKRFGKKLKGENRIMVAQVVKVIDGLTEWMTGSLQNKVRNENATELSQRRVVANSSQAEQGIVEPNALMKSRGIDQINLYKLLKYIQDSKLAFKVESYASHIEEKDSVHQASARSQSSPSSPVLHSLVAFIITLTNPSDEGRIFYEKITAAPGPSATATDIKLSYLLLSPTHAFSSIAMSARAVILAGGTMSPFDDYKNHLFPYLPTQFITTLSCDHVVPSSNLCVWTLASTKPNATDPSDQFEFSFQKRSDKDMIRKLGQALLNICAVVPDGVVVFFPSYGYLDQVIAAWQTSEAISSGRTIWDQLSSKKAVFRDSKGGSSDETLEEYSRAILGDVGGSSNGDVAGANGAKPTTRGALLLSVVGGKMSEGINFSDRLGRCVVVVGLPYPNINSPEWKARIEYIQASTTKRLLSSSSTTAATITEEQAAAQAKQVARDFYENACMRAVNQSIGRAIRHRGDYAAIVLVDRRFGTERIRGKLPGWIRGGNVVGSEGKGVQGLMGALNLFFRGKRGLVGRDGA